MKPPSRRTTGKLLTVTAVAGLALTLIASIVGYSLTGRIDHSLDRTVQITSQAIDSVDNSIDVSQQVVGTVGDALDTIASTVTTVQASLATANTTLDTLHAFLQDSLPKSINAIQAVLPTIQSVAGSIDSALRALSKLPIGPNYNPTVPFDQTIRQLADAIGGIPTNLQSLAVSVDALKTSTTSLSANLDQIKAVLDSVHVNVASAKQALGDYAQTAGQARLVAASTRHDINADTTLARVLVLIVGVLLALAQLAIFWVGRLLSGPSPLPLPPPTV